MRKILLSAITLLLFSAINAQTDPNQEYTGKYKFPDGSPVTEISVVLENGVLSANSAIGNSELKKTDTKDVFEVVAYGGTATFKRSTEGKVTGVQVQVQDVNMEGTKSEAAFIPRVVFRPVY
ncbi:MAG: hypothetical protein JNM88_03195 [Chitinophagaceae bacterium]|nr:hypothetical protein [Chitinophagaceae bacterium]